MIKKAYEKPKEIEYVEFKGSENHKEVCEFINKPEPLLTRTDGKEYLVLNYYVTDRENISIPTGYIFYKWYDAEFDSEEWDFSSKSEFFRKYSDLNQ